MLTFVSAPANSGPSAPAPPHQSQLRSGAAAKVGASGGDAAAEAKLAVGVASVVAGLAMAARRNRQRGADVSTSRRFNEEDIGKADLLAVIRDTKTFRESDRTTRRPVFGYPEWKNHRSAERFFRNLRQILDSRITKAIWLEVLTPTLIALLVVIGYDTDWAEVGVPAQIIQSFPAINIGALPFTISSAALSLLLVFKTNSAYDRWWEARIVWGAIVNKCRDMTRQSLARVDHAKHKTEKQEIVRLTAAFPRILHYHLSEQTPKETEVLEGRLGKLMPPAQVEKIMNATHKPMTLCGEISNVLERSGLEMYDKLKFDRILTDFADYYGMCERIFKTPIPLAYTRLTARFLTIWLMGMPFALYSQVNPHWAVVPVTAIISLFIFSIEELGMLIEEPFSVLPLEKIGDGIQGSMFEAMELDTRMRDRAEKRETAKKTILSSLST